MSDAESTTRLLARARAGDISALDTLFSRHAAPIKRWARGRLPRWARDVADTDDLVQETLLQTFKRIDSFEPQTEDALQAYLRQAVMNRVRDELRKHTRRPTADPLDSQMIDDGPSPHDQAVALQTMERYEQALSHLTEMERSAIIGRVEMDLSYDELAQVLEKPSRDAARKTAQRALVRLAEEMKRGQ